MTKPDEIYQEITTITAELIATGLSIDQNFPASKIRGGDQFIEFAGLSELSVTLKNVPYADAYTVIRDNRAFNIKMIDGALIQMLFTFSGGVLIKHRLAFFPSPDLLEYQNNSEIYDQDELYGDVIHRSVVTVPVRFDFDREGFVEADHPMSHLTLGQYRNCRIPVSAPLTPFYFIQFILRAFYNTPFNKFCADMRPMTGRFDATIAGREVDTPYLSVCGAAA